MDSHLLSRLQDAWKIEEPRRSAGGERALAGFEYQLMIALLETVRAWLADPVAVDPLTFAETLSDVVRNMDDHTIVTQVKHRESTPATRAAVHELWTIWNIARRTIPEACDQLSFRVLYRFGTGLTLPPILEEWQPDGAEPDAIADFTARVSAGITEDPENELLALLSNQVSAREPRARVRAWVGRLMEAAGQEQGFQNAARDIWDDLVTLRRDAQVGPLGFHLWESTDRPPGTLQPGAFLTGQPPRLSHLKQGYFAPRTELIDALALDVEHWLDRLGSDSTAELGLPIFWVGGRSGAGKSVVLLQLLARLHERGTRPILWLRNDPTLLPEAVLWSRSSATDGRRAVIAIDDPYVPGADESLARAWTRTLAYIDDLIDQDRAHEVPVLICCGPTEQARRLERGLADRVKLQLSSLPDETKSDLDQLRDWYRSRTGQAPPDTGDENVLLVQLFFEWSVGETISSFTNRFRRRVDAADPSGALAGAISKVLAVNRLYVSYPQAALETGLGAAQRDDFRRLQQERHFSSDEESSSGIRLAHPHLANAIYNNWYPAADALLQRQEILAGALEDVDHHGLTPSKRAAPLVAIAHELARAEDDPDRRVDPGTDELLRRTYATAMRESASRPDAGVLAAWLTVQTRGGVSELVPDPVDVAIDLLRAADELDDGLRLLSGTLLRQAESLDLTQRAGVVDALVDVAERWIDQPGVAGLLDQCLRDTPNQRLAALAVQWAVANPTHWRAGPLMAKVLHSGPSRAVVEQAARFFPLVSSHRSWSDVATTLLKEHSGEPFDAALQWVRRHCRSPYLGPSIAELLAQHHPEAEALAARYTEACVGHPAASFVLEALLSHTAPSPELLAMCRSHLEFDPQDGGFLVSLIVTRAPLTDAVDIGLRWLDAHPEQTSSWTHVWERLVQRDAHAAHQSGMAWLLSSDRAAKEWSYVFELVLPSAGTEDHAVLRQAGEAWLVAHPVTHSSWPWIWQALWKDHPSPSLPPSGLRWLEATSGEHPMWAANWLRLAKHDLSNGLLQAGRGWLLKFHPDPQWDAVWRTTVDALDDPAELRTLAIAWLRETEPANPAWPRVVDRLVRERRDDEITDLVMSSLSVAPPWSETFVALWDMIAGVLDTTPVERTAMSWLIQADGRHRNWVPIWRRLRKSAPSPALDYVTHRWLAEQPQHPSHHSVLELVLEQDRDDPRAARLAQQWLASAGMDRRWWSLWRRLWATDPSVESGRLALRHHPALLDSSLWPAATVELLADDQLREEAASQAWTWLSDRHSWQRPAWWYVWCAVDDASSAHATVELGLDWLDAVGVPNMGWPIVKQQLGDRVATDVLDALTRQRRAIVT